MPEDDLVAGDAVCQLGRSLITRDHEARAGNVMFYRWGGHGSLPFPTFAAFVSSDSGDTTPKVASMPCKRFLTTFLFLTTGLASSTPIECSAQVPAPEYEARGNRPVHQAPGGYDVEVDSSLRYVGGQRFHIRS